MYIGYIVMVNSYMVYEYGFVNNNYYEIVYENN